MELFCKEFTMPKQEVIKGTFEQTIDQYIVRCVEREIIKEMFDSGCFKIKKIADPDSDRVFIRVSVVLDNAISRTQVPQTKFTQHSHQLYYDEQLDNFEEYNLKKQQPPQF